MDRGHGRGGTAGQLRAGTVTAMAVSYDERTALVVVDVQNDFADPAGSLSVPGADDVITAVNDEIDAATAAGAVVVYTQDWHPPRTPHFVTDGGPWPVHCVRDTWGAALHPAPDRRRAARAQGHGRRGRLLRVHVRDHDRRRVRDRAPRPAAPEAVRAPVVVVGLALDYCVKETALDAVAARLRHHRPARGHGARRGARRRRRRRRGGDDRGRRRAGG